MDGDRFDAWTKAMATPSRRRLLRLLAGGALATRLAAVGREAAAQDQQVGIATCRERGDNCDRRDQCCEAQEGHRIACRRVSQACAAGPFPGGRCCGRGGARCSGNCDCCQNYRCKLAPGATAGECRPI